MATDHARSPLRSVPAKAPERYPHRGRRGAIRTDAQGVTAHAAIPEPRMWDGSWERAPVRTIATTALGFRGLIGWIGELGFTPDQTRIGLEPTGGWYGRTMAAWLERHGYRVDWLQNFALHDRRKLMIGNRPRPMRWTPV